MYIALKRIAAIWLSIVMVICMFPSDLFADTGNTDEEDISTVRVYLSISDDSEFVTGRDSGGRVMARVPMDVPYVDLADYGLESYYRYEAKSFEDGGQYIFPYVLVEQPTLLMCFIKALSQYYLGREMTNADVGTEAMEVSGGATSLYFLHYFGHFYNFMYFVNHAYPLMAKGWGSTADYILLEDGDEIDIGMFTDTRFNQYGGFAYFNEGNVSLTAGDSLDLSLYLTKSKESGGSDYNGPMYKEPIRVSKDYGKTWQTNQYVTNKQGEFTASFDEAGVYYLSGGPKFKNQPYQQLQCIAPPICVVEVKPMPVSNCFYEISETVIKVSWDASPGAEGYEIKYKDTEGNIKAITQEDTEAILIDANSDDVDISVVPYVTDRYVAMGEENKTLKGEPVAATLDPEDLVVSALAEAKTNAKSYLAAYKDGKDPSLYRDEQKEELAQLVEQGNAAIDAAQTVDDVVQVLSEAKSAIDAVKTDAEYTAEEEEAREEEERKRKEHEAAVRKAAIKKAKAARTAVSVKALKKHKAKITWKKVTLSYTVDGKKYTETVTGYKVYRATKKNGKYRLIKTIKKAGTLKYTDTKLKKGRKYYYKVRTYTKIDGKAYLGKWSKTKKITAK